ncbi:MAG: polysaccharide biosynthesis/export family protein [Verrucomicrobiota bacterium]
MKLFALIAVVFLSLPGSAQDLLDYKIAPLDVLVIDVVNEKDLPREFKVTTKGEIPFPYLGNLKVAGFTAEEIQNELKEKLEKDYLVNPQVIVQVKERVKRKVNVTGQVFKQGPVEMPDDKPELTIWDAIGMAGGTTRLASGSVQVTRSGQKPLKFDLEKLRKETDPTKLFILQAGDSIFVPESRF